MDKLKEIGDKATPSPEQIEAATGFLKENAKYIIGGLIIFSIVMFILVGLNRKSEQEKKFPMLVKHPRDASKPLYLEAVKEKLPDVSTAEATISVWVYLKKSSSDRSHHIVSLGESQSDRFTSSIRIAFFPDSHNNPNNLQVSVAQEGDNVDVINKEDTLPHESCHLSSLPLKKWCHVAVCVWNQNVDVYLNGKLARSCVLAKPTQISPEKNDIIVTSDKVDEVDSSLPGFDGYLSRLQMSNMAISPEDVYKIYLKGPYSGSWWSSSKSVTDEPETTCNK